MARGLFWWPFLITRVPPGPRFGRSPMRKHVRANLSSVHNSSSGAMGKKKKKNKKARALAQKRRETMDGGGGRVGEGREVPSEERRAVRSYGTYLRKFRTHGGIAGRAGSAKQFEVLAKCCGK